MSIKNGFIVKPVGFNDIGNTLNDTTYNIQHLCRNVNINKWSLHKPVVFPNKLGELTEAEYQSVDYGLEPVVIDNANPGVAMNLINHVNAHGGVDWDYIRPTGGAASPFRIADFIGYQHSRQPWFNLQLGVEQGNYAYVSPGQSITVEQDADIDIGWLRQNMQTFKNIGGNLGCSGVFVYKEGMTASNDYHLFCAFRSLRNLNGRSNFVVGIPSDWPEGKYLVVPCIAYFPYGLPSKIADLTDSTGSYNYVFFRGTADAAEQNPPRYMFSRIAQLYPLPCKPGKIQVSSGANNASIDIIVNLVTTAGTYGITTTATTYNGKSAWLVKMWGDIKIAMRSGLTTYTPQSVQIWLDVPNCTNAGGFTLNNGKPYKSASVRNTTGVTTTTTSSNPITFYLVEGEFDPHRFGWYDGTDPSNPVFHCAYIPYTKTTASGGTSSGVFSVLD